MTASLHLGSTDPAKEIRGQFLPHGPLQWDSSALLPWVCKVFLPQKPQGPWKLWKSQGHKRQRVHLIHPWEMPSPLSPSGQQRKSPGSRTCPGI